MKELPKLESLSHEEKDGLIKGLWQKVQELQNRVEKLEQKQVKKTAKNSSIPPSQGFKANQTEEKKTRKRREAKHQKGGRELSQNPDQIVISCHHFKWI